MNAQFGFELAVWGFGFAIDFHFRNFVAIVGPLNLEVSW